MTVFPQRWRECTAPGPSRTTGDRHIPRTFNFIAGGSGQDLRLIKAIRQRFSRRAEAGRESVQERRLRWRERRWIRWLRRIGWALVAVYFIAAALMLTVRYLVVPHIGEYRQEITAAASSTLGQRVSIDEVQADWHGFHPRLELRGIRVFDAQDRHTLTIPRVSGVIAWRSALMRNLYFRSIEVEGLELSVRRGSDGRLYVAGLDMHDHDSSAADWFLEQGLVHLVGARVTWTDELRAAPPLELRALDLLLANEGDHHRFALSAEPPAEHASRIDLRGDLIGESAAQLREWNGRLYASFDYLDLAAWQQWLDYPFELRGGRGALRLWLGFAEDRLVQAHAQVAMADVTTRFAKSLPLMQLRSVQGEFGAEEKLLGFSLVGIGPKELAYDAYARRLKLVLHDGVQVQPADFSAHWEPAGGDKAERGEVLAERIDLRPLVALSGYLPLPPRVRSALDRLDPRGALRDIELSWSGPWAAPVRYSAKGAFNNLSMRPYEHLPGFSNLSGRGEWNERGGKAELAARKSVVEYPGVLPEPIPLDELDARLNWTTEQGATLVALEQVSLKQADASASVTGKLRVDAKHTVYLDLQGNADEVPAVTAHRYIPFLPRDTDTWLRESLLSGKATALQFRLRGTANDFPYNDPKLGEFKLSGKLEDVQFRYDPAWPQIDHASGSIRFDGPMLRIDVAQAQTFGAKLSQVKAVIPDFYHDHPMLKVEGRAEAPTQAFLQYVEKSPVREMLGDAVAGWGASGNGHLDLSLDLPLGEAGETKVRGRFEMANNNLIPGPGQTPITKVNGAVDFSAAGASSNGIQGQYLGGPLRVQIATRDEVVNITAQGSADSAALVQELNLGIADRVRGPLTYKAAIVTRNGQTSSVFESNLQGVALDLPAPLGKAANEALPLRVERTELDQTRENLTLRMGKVLAANGVLRLADNRRALDRAGVALGEIPVPKAEAGAIALAANLDQVDVDRIFALLRSKGAAGSGEFPSITAVELKARRFIAGRRVFNDMNLQAQRRGQGWRGEVRAKELGGEISWEPQGRGLVRAKLQYLIHPEAAPTSAAQDVELKELPELDIVADSYMLEGRPLGRLELRALNEAGVWRITTASLTTPEGVASATGSWRAPAPNTQERTELDVDLKTTDIGRYLARLGYPEAVARGEGSLKGALSWRGPPFALDYPSMQGQVEILAERGQFVKLKPGIGKLLGVLSLQSLPRRLTLDFRDVFSEGFSFDRIEGNAEIARGIISTKDLSMTGPAASVAITGSANLIAETQDLHVRVIPTVGDSVATAAGIALLNPLVGLGAFLTQRLLRDPIGQIFAFEYAITGSWDDPKVEKLGGPQQQSAAVDAEAVKTP
jgi:uncharacterized protein (TIGR02099 family)